MPSDKSNRVGKYFRQCPSCLAVLPCFNWSDVETRIRRTCKKCGDHFEITIKPGLGEIAIRRRGDG